MSLGINQEDSWQKFWSRRRILEFLLLNQGKEKKFQSVKMLGLFHAFFQDYIHLRSLKLEIGSFFEEIHLPWIYEDYKERMDQKITQGETEQAINNLKGGKTPGLNGFSVEFCKTFKAQISGRLWELFRACFSLGKLPPSWRQAKIRLIPEEEMDLSKPESYRPMSLLNEDYKILVSILIPRLSTFVGEYTGDQTGFLKQWYIRSSIRRVINLIEMAQVRKDPTIFYFLYAAKAFDRVEWDFLL